MSISNTTFSFAIRPFQKEDAERVLEIRKDILRSMNDETNYPKSVMEDMIQRVSKERLQEFSEQEGSFIYVAETEINGKRVVVGSCGATTERTNNAACGVLKLLFVEREFQNKGVGTKLVNKCEELGKENQWTSIKSQSTVGASERFMPRLGYAKDGEEVGNMGRVILMSKKLIP